MNTSSSVAKRYVHEFTIPPGAVLPEEMDPGMVEVKTVGLVLLTPAEEKHAVSRCRGDTSKLAYELSQMSLAEVNGVAVVDHDGSVDRAMLQMHPVIRTLVMQAYAELSAPKE